MPDKLIKKSLVSITKGSSLYIFGKIVSDAVGFVIQLILTRYLGASLYGVYAYGTTISGILSVLTNLGTDKSLIKYLPQYENSPKKQNFVLFLATCTSILGSVVVCISIFILAPFISKITIDHYLFADVLRLFIIILTFDTIANIIYTTFRSLEQLEYEILTHRVLYPILRLIGVSASIIVGFSLLGILSTLVVASLITLLISTYILNSRFSIKPSRSVAHYNRLNIKEYYNFSVPLVFKDVGYMLINRVDILMVGFFLSSAQVGIYNIALVLATLVSIPKSATNQLFPPIASRLHSDGKYDELNLLYKTITRWVFSFALLGAVGLIVYHNEILSLFGDEFRNGSLVLILYVIGKLFDTLGGANGYLLMITEWQYLLAVNQWFFGIINVILNYILITQFGMIGAAIATVMVYSTWNITKTIQLWYLEGLCPYGVSFLKPLIAGLFSMGVMVLLGHYLNGIIYLIVGGLVGILIYFLILISLGIEESDKDLLNEII